METYFPHPVPGCCEECYYGENCCDEYDYDVNTKGFKEFILLIASYNGRLDCVKVCLSAEIHVDVNFRDSRFCYNPLYCSVNQGHGDCVEFLIKSGAEIYDDILKAAGTETKSEECMNLILEAAGDDAVVKMLFILVEAGHLARLFGGGASAISNTEFDETVLFYDNKLNQLLKTGVDVNIKDEYGKTALLYAIFYSAQSVELLLKAGADVNTRAEYGEHLTLCSRLFSPSCRSATEGGSRCECSRQMG